MKKSTGDIIILLMCTKNHFWVIFYLFTPLTTQKTKMKEASGDVIILHMHTNNYDQMMHGSGDMVCNRQMGKRVNKKSNI